ncbi:MAG: hypothetical protein LBC53_06025 [Spirochaetaceae bacterium]|nr:hypothetical protein [Spirochaetaceae bacterium]
MIYLPVTDLLHKPAAAFPPLPRTDILPRLFSVKQGSIAFRPIIEIDTPYAFPKNIRKNVSFFFPNSIFQGGILIA